MILQLESFWVQLHRILSKEKSLHIHKCDIAWTTFISEMLRLLLMIGGC
jgi:hypothetical protein